MHLHFLGICGTFMGSLAILAREMGYTVSGSDQQVYPPMSDQLQAAGIQLHEGFDYNPEDFKPDLVIVGNVMSRGQPCVEALLESKLPYTSGPQWLHDYLLRGKTPKEEQAQDKKEDKERWRWVLAVAGTHGKTTTASMLAWLLEDADMNPGFLIGGVPANFGIPARLGGTDFFVIEADEYDTAFFDKRSKFVHYQPRTLVLNNLEFDHADIFPDLAAIQTQFHHLMRLLPTNGRVIYPQGDAALQTVIAKGCWSEQETLGGNKADWQAVKQDAAGSCFKVYLKGDYLGEVNWALTGEHNINNALAALAAARHVGVEPSKALESLGRFLSVKRRMELLGEVAGVQVYDDFAHHPTAIATTLEGARPGCKGRLIAVIEPRSNTMQLGTLRAALPASVELADAVYWYQSSKMSWSPAELKVGQSFTALAELKAALLADVKPNDWVVLMSNGSFGGLHQEIMQALTTRAAEE